MRFLIRRIGSGLLIIWGIVSILFVIFNVLGDPVKAIAGQRSDKMTEEAIRKMYYLDRPPLTQYLLYLNDLSPLGIQFSGDLNASQYTGLSLFTTASGNALMLKKPYLRRSFQSNRQVTEIISEKLPGTFILALAAMLIATFAGIGAGTFAAIKKNEWTDRFLIILTMLGISAPSFFTGIVIMRIFAVDLAEWTNLNVSGYIFEENIFDEGMSVHWKHLILPAFALGIRPLAIITQLTRSSLIESLSEDYIRTARAKGIHDRWVILKHGLRNALNPVVTSISGWFASLLAGAFFIEYIFGWQGIGKLTIDALAQKDFPVILGSSLVIGVIFVAVNIIVDLLYSRLDPRVRLK